MHILPYLCNLETQFFYDKLCFHLSYELINIVSRLWCFSFVNFCTIISINQRGGGDWPCGNFQFWEVNGRLPTTLCTLMEQFVLQIFI